MHHDQSQLLVISTESMSNSLETCSRSAGSIIDDPAAVRQTSCILRIIHQERQATAAVIQLRWWLQFHNMLLIIVIVIEVSLIFALVSTKTEIFQSIPEHAELKKSKEGYSSLQASLPSLLRELTCHMGSHSVTCHPPEVTFPPLPQPKLVLDLATPEGCKAELTQVAG